MDERKMDEIKHYDRLAREWRERAVRDGTEGDIEMINVMRMESYRAVYRELAARVAGKRVLDYGCGHGMHAIEIARMGATEVVGIDLSTESLAIAEERARKSGRADRIRFIPMDAEHTDFPNESFDVVFDGGTFSSIDIGSAYREIARVLKPDGFLIGIETLGHHPIANLKRKINVWRRIRTAWAASHIMTMGDVRMADRYFEKEPALFFHFLGLLALPFSRFPGGSLLVMVADACDKILFTFFPFLKRYGFKVVFVFRKK